MYRILETSQGFKIQTEHTTSLLGFLKTTRWVDLGIKYKGRFFQTTYYKSIDEAKAKIKSLVFKDKVVCYVN